MASWWSTAPGGAKGAVDGTERLPAEAGGVGYTVLVSQIVTYIQTSFASVFAPLSKGVTNGDNHDHTDGDGAQIDHGALANAGVNTHAQIDSALSGLGTASTNDTGDFAPALGVDDNYVTDAEKIRVTALPVIAGQVDNITPYTMTNGGTTTHPYTTSNSFSLDVSALVTGDSTTLAVTGLPAGNCVGTCIITTGADIGFTTTDAFLTELMTAAEASKINLINWQTIDQGANVAVSLAKAY